MLSDTWEIRLSILLDSKELRIYLDRINTATNFVNGAPSTLLAIIPVSDRMFGKAVACRFECPVFKSL